MRTVQATVCILVFSCAALAQSDRGTITGTVSDPAGAVVANAAIQAKNVGTGGLYDVVSTATGNYTLAELPVGRYEVSVTVPGFKKFVRQGLTLQVAQTLRIDITLDVGNVSESVTVSEATPLLKTESGELSHNVTTERMDSLPLLPTGPAAGNSGIRNPMAVVALLPGSFYSGTGANATNSAVRINGAPTNTEVILVEGQDATNPIAQGLVQQNQPGAIVSLGGLSIAHRETPGHAEDGVTYLISGWPDTATQVAVVGDTILAGSMCNGNGHWPLAKQKIYEHILPLAADTLLCPGHGPVTTVAQEKANNPFF